MALIDVICYHRQQYRTTAYKGDMDNDWAIGCNHFSRNDELYFKNDSIFLNKQKQNQIYEKQNNRISVHIVVYI